jgi:hypothetical protein
MELIDAVAIVLQYDILPKSLLSAEERIALAAAKDVIKDAAYRASVDFINQEASHKYR